MCFVLEDSMANRYYRRGEHSTSESITIDVGSLLRVRSIKLAASVAAFVELPKQIVTRVVYQATRTWVTVMVFQAKSSLCGPTRGFLSCSQLDGTMEKQQKEQEPVIQGSRGV